MSNKTYLISILQELEWEIKEAKWLLIMLEMWIMTEDNIDAIILLLKQTLKTTKNNQKVKNIQNNIDKLEKIKKQENKDKKEDINSLERLLSNL